MSLVRGRYCVGRSGRTGLDPTFAAPRRDADRPRDPGQPQLVVAGVALRLPTFPLGGSRRADPTVTSLRVGRLFGVERAWVRGASLTLFHLDKRPGKV